MAVDTSILIITRASDLARKQTDLVHRHLLDLHPDIHFQINAVSTKGDEVLDKPLAKIGDKGLFTQALEEALLYGDADMAVHSLKDLPTQLPKEMKIGAVCKRENLRDAFVSKDGTKLADLPEGATVGTSSLRRRSQLLAFRPDLNVVDMRGNLNTRWRKLHESDEMAGLILAAAGLLRMGWEERITEFIDTDIMLPAVGQGAIAVEIRQGDPFMDQLTAELTDADAWRDTMCERALLRRLEGGCQVPIGAYARMDDGDFILEGMIGSLDGTRIVRDGLIGDPADPEGLGNALAERLLDKGGDEILAEVRAAEAEG